MKKSEMLTLINEKISKCEKCSELVCDRLHVVPGEGNVNAKILCVGEGPGKDESESGRPFVGKAGQLLNNIITAAGWKREDIFHG